METTRVDLITATAKSDLLDDLEAIGKRTIDH